jgi:hypothetical protein
MAYHAGILLAMVSDNDGMRDQETTFIYYLVSKAIKRVGVGWGWGWGWGGGGSMQWFTHCLHISLLRGVLTVLLPTPPNLRCQVGHPPYMHPTLAHRISSLVDRHLHAQNPLLLSTSKPCRQAPRRSMLG